MLPSAGDSAIEITARLLRHFLSIAFSRRFSGGCIERLGWVVVGVAGQEEGYYEASEIMRKIVAANIRACRKKRFPGHGGAKKCADAFGVSPQQWSPWERGVRNPDAMRLRQIAEFFGVTEEFLRTDPKVAAEKAARVRVTDLFSERVAGQPGVNVSPGAEPLPGWALDLPSLRKAQPGSAESFYWLAERFLDVVQRGGVKITIDMPAVSRLCELLVQKKQEDKDEA